MDSNSSGMLGYTKMLKYWKAMFATFAVTDLISAFGTMFMYQVLWCSFVLFVKNAGIVLYETRPSTCSDFSEFAFQ